MIVPAVFQPFEAGPLWQFALLAIAGSLGNGDPTSSTAQLCAGVPGQPACVSMCSSYGGNNATIDLTSLVPNSTVGPVFTNIQDPDGDATYSYNPCYPFDFKDCKNAHVCFVGDALVENLGDGGSEKMMMGSDGIPYLHYSSPVDDPSSLKVVVYLYCTSSKDPTIAYLGDRMPQDIYRFNLSCCHVCPGGCPTSNGKHKPGLRAPIGYVGIIVVFMVLGALVVYCVLGSVLLRVKKKDSFIPNQKFWTALPYLIKDGCWFSLEPFVMLISQRIQRKSYQTIQGKNNLRYT